jgi:hypothetical protein
MSLGTAVVNVSVRYQIKVLETDRPCNRFALKSELCRIFIDADPFKLSFTLALPMINDLLKIRIEHVDFLSVVVEPVIRLAFSIVV